jgi:hypothetical protein
VLNIAGEILCARELTDTTNFMNHDLGTGVYILGLTNVTEVEFLKIVIE